jgi:hypothetical protein
MEIQKIKREGITPPGYRSHLITTWNVRRVTVHSRKAAIPPRKPKKQIYRILINDIVVPGKGWLRSE